MPWHWWPLLLGSEYVEGVNAISGDAAVRTVRVFDVARCGGSPVTANPPFQRGYHVHYYRTFAISSASSAERRTNAVGLSDRAS
jgi:hypothetical protein